MIGAGPLGRPLRRAVDREEIITVDPQRGEAEADRAGREGRRLAAGNLLVRGDRPLVVDDIQNNRRAVHRGEGQRMVEIGLGGRAFADPARGDAVVALDRRRHGPAHRLRVLNAEIAGERKERCRARRIRSAAGGSGAPVHRRSARRRLPANPYSAR